MRTLIILHGWQSSKEKWEDVKLELQKQGFNVLIPDLPGFKKEAELSLPFDLDDYVDWLSNYLKDLKEPFFLLGHSFGGRIAIKFTAMNKDKVLRLILVSSAGLREKSFKREVLEKIAKVGKKFSSIPGFDFLRKAFYKVFVRSSDYLRVQGPMKETFKNIIKEDLTSFLPLISVPTLLIWGSKDRMTPLSSAYKMKGRIKNAELQILKGIGHTPYLESPHLLAKKIIEFLR